MIKKEVNEEVFPTDLQMHLAPNKGESRTKLHQKLLDMVNQPLFLISEGGRDRDLAWARILSAIFTAFKSASSSRGRNPISLKEF